MRRKSPLVVLILLLLIAFQCPSIAQDPELTQDALQEVKENTNKALSVLEKVSVYVTFSKAEEVEMSKTNIKTNAELQLRKAGIPVVDMVDMTKYTGLLHVNIFSLISEDLITFYVSCKLRHRASPLGTDTSLAVPIYETAPTVGTVRPEEAEESINKAITQKTRTFMNRWLKAH